MPEPAPFDWVRTPQTDSLRTRFALPGRLSPKLLTIVPWVDVFILAISFAFFAHATALVAGIPVDISLPQGSFIDGAPVADSVAIVVRSRSQGFRPMVFLADVGYELSSHTEIEAFVKSLSQLRDRQGARRAMLFMDSDIPYSEIVFIIEKIRRAGLDGISFVERVQ